MENLNKQIQELQKIIDTYGNIVFFRWCRCLHREWNPGFPKRGRTVSPTVRLPAGDDFKSHLLSFPHGGILPFLPE